MKTEAELRVALNAMKLGISVVNDDVGKTILTVHETRAWVLGVAPIKSHPPIEESVADIKRACEKVSARN